MVVSFLYVLCAHCNKSTKSYKTLYFLCFRELRMVIWIGLCHKSFLPSVVLIQRAKLKMVCIYPCCWAFHFLVCCVSLRESGQGICELLKHGVIPGEGGSFILRIRKINETYCLEGIFNACFGFSVQVRHMPTILPFFYGSHMPITMFTRALLVPTLSHTNTVSAFPSMPGSCQ
jgi:hypothetical protein